MHQDVPRRPEDATVLPAVPVASAPDDGRRPGQCYRFENLKAEREDFTFDHLDRMIAIAFWCLIPTGVAGFVGLALYPRENLVGTSADVDMRVWLAVAAGVALGKVALVLLGMMSAENFYGNGDVVYMNNELAEAAIAHRNAGSREPYLLFRRPDGTVEAHPAPTRQTIERYELRTKYSSALLLVDCFLLVWIIVGIRVFWRIKPEQRVRGPHLFSYWIALTAVIGASCLFQGMQFEYLSPITMCRRWFPPLNVNDFFVPDQELAVAPRRPSSEDSDLRGAVPLFGIEVSPGNIIPVYGIEIPNTDRTSSDGPGVYIEGNPNSLNSRERSQSPPI